MHGESTRLIQAILHPRPMADAARAKAPATAFAIADILAPRAAVLRVDPAALVPPVPLPAA